VEEGDNFLFLDFGGGTFDVSILQFFDESSCVIISNGAQHLGGNDFDKALLDYCFSNLLDNYKINLKEKKYKKEYRKARRSCKEYKIKISKCQNSSKKIKIGNKDYTIEINRAKFEELIEKKNIGLKLKIYYKKL
jgi:molecular chaperone DnaK